MEKGYAMNDVESFRTLAALVAMHAILNRVVNIDAAVLSEDAYAVADAMLMAREVKEVEHGNA